MDGAFDTSNSNVNGGGPFSVSARKGLFDLGGANDTAREDAINRTLDSSTFDINSVNGNTLNQNVYDGNRMDINPSVNTGLSFMATRKRVEVEYSGHNSAGHIINKKSVDPAMSFLQRANDRNASNAFYASYSDDVQARSNFMRQDAYDSNGE